MKKIAVAVAASMMSISAFAAPDWAAAPVTKMTLFYPGQSSLEWVMNKADHSAVPDIVEKKRACAKCHTGDANEIGDKIVKGQPVGSSKTVLEPKPPEGKVGSIPVQFQAVHDGSKLYVRVEWVPPQNGKLKLDAKNEVKLTMMFDGGDTVEGSTQNGCWATCHTDLRTMKDAHQRSMAQAYRGRCGTQIGFDGKLARLIQAGSDCFVMPSRSEPCGLTQMYAMRYGTLPIVRATGGLVDTVQNFEEGQPRGTGFVFHAATAGALADTLGWACATYYDRPQEFAGLQQRAMAQDFSWRHNAGQYVDLYRWAVEQRTGVHPS